MPSLLQFFFLDKKKLFGGHANKKSISNQICVSCCIWFILYFLNFLKFPKFTIYKSPKRWGQFYCPFHTYAAIPYCTIFPMHFFNTLWFLYPQTNILPTLLLTPSLGPSLYQHYLIMIFTAHFAVKGHRMCTCSAGKNCQVKNKYPKIVLDLKNAFKNVETKSRIFFKKFLNCKL